jgi:hypothetical protein
MMVVRKSVKEIHDLLIEELAHFAGRQILAFDIFPARVGIAHVVQRQQRNLTVRSRNLIAKFIPIRSISAFQRK